MSCSTDRDSDGLRDMEAADTGVQILRITAGMLREEPEQTRARVTRILRRRLVEQAGLRDTVTDGNRPSYRL